MYKILSLFWIGLCSTNWIVAEDLLNITSACYDDICVNADEMLPAIWFNDRPETFSCPEPYAECNVGMMSYHFCKETMGFSGYDVSICSHNIWRWYAIKEQIILTNRFNPNEKVNFLGFSRSNNWFVNAAYLPGVLSKSLIKYLGDDFLLAKPLRLLEIGSYEGGSSVWFIRYMLSHSQSLLTCIDPWSPEVCEGMNHSLAYDTFMANIALTNKASQVRVVRNDSMLALAKLLVDGETFDFIYIDGSHLLVDVIADLALSWQLLAVGGVLAIDDVPAQAEGSGYVDNYTFKPSNLGTKASPPYCSVLHTPDSRGRFLLEDSIVAFLAHLPGCDVLYCGYQIAVKKLH